MTNKENYQRTFSVLHASEKLTLEDRIMSKKKRTYIPRVAIVLVALVVVLGSGSAAYANNLGGIQRTLQIWFHGDQTNVTFDLDEGTYSGTYQTPDGKTKEFSGGGVATNLDGTVRPVTEEEMIAHLNAPDVDYLDDGSVWLYYHDQAMEITDMFNEDGVCFIQVHHGDETRYVTVKYGKGLASSPHSYMQPNEFNNY